MTDQRHFNLIEISHQRPIDKKMRETLILKEIDQLENAVNSFSKSTNWMKKACVPISTALATLLLRNLLSVDDVVIVVFLIIFFSWLLDSYCFYYQRLLRVKMEKDFCLLYSEWNKDRTLCEPVTRKQALFDKSNFLYFIFFFIIFLILIRSCLERLIMWILSI